MAFLWCYKQIKLKPISVQINPLSIRNYVGQRICNEVIKSKRSTLSKEPLIVEMLLSVSAYQRTDELLFIRMSHLEEERAGFAHTYIPLVLSATQMKKWQDSNCRLCQTRDECLNMTFRAHNVWIWLTWRQRPSPLHSQHKRGGNSPKEKKKERNREDWKKRKWQLQRENNA